MSQYFEADAVIRENRSKVVVGRVTRSPNVAGNVLQVRKELRRVLKELEDGIPPSAIVYVGEEELNVRWERDETDSEVRARLRSQIPAEVLSFMDKNRHLLNAAMNI